MSLKEEDEKWVRRKERGEREVADKEWMEVEGILTNLDEEEEKWIR